MRQKSIEDYMITLYRLHLVEKEAEKGVKSVDVSRNLHVSKASVSKIIRKLKDQGYITTEPYGKVFFTDKGIRKAREVKRRHDVIEEFLHTVLGYSEKKAHIEAHTLEHAFTNDSIKRLNSFMRRLN